MSFLDDVLDDSEFDPELTSCREVPENFVLTATTPRVLAEAPIRYVGADRGRLDWAYSTAQGSGGTEGASTAGLAAHARQAPAAAGPNR